MTTAKRVAEIEIVDHGIDWPDYFSGCGVAFTEFDNCATGVADTPAEAIADALEMIAQSESAEVLADIEYLVCEELGADWEDKYTTPSAYAEAESNIEQPAPDWRLSFAAYCGMSHTIAEDLDRDDCRAEAARYLRRMRRRGYPIAIITRGEEWEILEPDNCALVPDDCGILSIDDYTPEAPEIEEWPYYHVTIRYRYATAEELADDSEELA